MAKDSKGNCLAALQTHKQVDFPSDQLLNSRTGRYRIEIK